MWFSSVVITLENDVNVDNFINTVKQQIDSLSFPDDVTDPVVTEISTDNEVLFQMLLYGNKDTMTMNQLRSLAHAFTDEIEWKAWIIKASVDWSNDDSDYDVTLLIERTQLETFWLTLSSIAQNIKAFNANLPLWNHTLWDLVYDYRISWEKNK